MISYVELNDFEKDWLLDRYEDHQRYCKYLGVKSMKWYDFRCSMLRDLERIGEIKKSDL